jgi:hypothetical protein
MAAIILIPVILAFVLKVNGAVLFMSLCVGSVLVRYAGNDVISFVTTMSPHANQFSQSTLKLSLLLAPAVISFIFMFHSVKGFSAVLNILPALGSGLLMVILIEPLLSVSEQITLTSTSLWQNVIQAQTLIVLSGAVISLLFLWIKRFNHQGGSHHRSSKRQEAN